MTHPLRVGIAGYGLAGRIFHGPLLRGAGYDVHAILTKDPARVAQARADFPEAKIVADIKALVAHPLDLLVVASANLVHAEQAMVGLRAGIPVVVDKPMGRTLAETNSIISLSEEMAVPVTVFFNRRWDSDALTIKRVMAEGLLGKIFRLDSRYERFRPDLTPGSWREGLTPQEGGGLLLDLQSHLISQALDWFGPADLKYSSVRSVRGAADDDVVIALSHRSGVDSYLSTSSVAGSFGPRIRILGTKGALIINDLDPQEALLRTGAIPVGGKWAVATSSKALLHQGESVREIVTEDGNYATFYTLVRGALRNENPWPVSTADAQAVARLVDEARKESIR